MTDRVLIFPVSPSSREDQECRGERSAAHVPEVPAILLALSAEHGKCRGSPHPINAEMCVACVRVIMETSCYTVAVTFQNAVTEASYKRTSFLGAAGFGGCVHDLCGMQ